MKEVTTTVQIKPNYKIHPQKHLFKALGVEPGDFVEVVIRKIE